MNKDLLFHIHIPKTAGSSLRQAFLDSGWVMANRIRSGSIDNPDGNFVSGHFMFGRFRHFRLGRRTIYVTTLRQPDQLMRSMHRFVLSKKDHPFYNDALHGIDFFCTQKKMINVQSRFLAGKIPSFLYGKGVLPDFFLYFLAARNLRKIHFVGIQGDMDSLFEKLKTKGLVNDDIPSIARRNISAEGVSLPNEESLIRKIDSLNGVDCRIYDLASVLCKGSGLG